VAVHRRLAAFSLLFAACTPGKTGGGGGGGGACGNCDDAVECTVDTCDDRSGQCLHAPDDAACDDGAFCNGVETCEGAEGCAAGTPETCDDGRACTDDSCDAETDECVSVGNAPPPDAPRLLAPWNGEATGSVHAAGRGTLRPRFRWREVPLESGEAASYEIQADDSCDVGLHADCEMASPALDAATVATEFTPEEDLPVSETQPVGARYVWRVRACDPCSSECGAWSAGRYVDVGRERSDFDGDGYADLLVSAHVHDFPQLDEGNAWVYFGGAAGVEASPSNTLDNPLGQASGQFGRTHAAVGDLDGDGYGDAVVGALVQDNPEGDEGNAYVYRGGPSGLPAAPNATLDNPSDQGGTQFSISVSGAGDVNADGYADVLVSSHLVDWPEADEGIAYLYLGGAAGIADGAAPTMTLDSPADQPTAYFGAVVAGLGDIDADGHSDVAVSAHGHDAAVGQEGAVFVYLGAPAGLTDDPATIGNPADQANGWFGWYMGGAGDVNGDGFGDLVAAAYAQDLPSFDEGVTYVFHGSDTGIVAGAVPDTTLDNAQDQAYGLFGYSVASAGDVNDDGFSDIVVGAHGQDGAAVDTGAAFLYLGGASGIDPLGAVTIPSPSGQLSAWFAWAPPGAGDVNGDGFCDVAIGAHGYDGPAQDEGAAWVFHGSETGLGEVPAIGLENPVDQAWAYFGVWIGTRPF